MLVAVLLILAAVTVIVAVALVSMGRGGEMAEFPPDLAPLRLPDAGALTAADVVGVHLPMGLIGYHPGSVDETLRRAGRALNDREARIAALERRLAELAAGATPPRPPPGEMKRGIDRRAEPDNAWFEEEDEDDEPVPAESVSSGSVSSGSVTSASGSAGSAEREAS